MFSGGTVSPQGQALIFGMGRADAIRCSTNYPTTHAIGSGWKVTLAPHDCTMTLVRPKSRIQSIVGINVSQLQRAFVVRHSNVIVYLITVSCKWTVLFELGGRLTLRYANDDLIE